MKMLRGLIYGSVGIGLLWLSGARAGEPDRKWLDSFGVNEKNLSSTGRNTCFILEPGYQLVFEGKEDGAPVQLTITVLNETKRVDGVETRVVEERETNNGKLAEVSRNYFAFDPTAHDVYYFGEDVDMYKDGKVINHEGGWLSGVKGAKYGMAMSGSPRVGNRYFQEVAPGIAMDRAEVVSTNEIVSTPAGIFVHCVKTEETTPLEPKSREYKYYAPEVGLIQDGDLKLARHGQTKD
jgi:hypothetical protein